MIDMMQVQKELMEAEKLINIARKTREDAIKAKTESETKVKISREELKNLGVDPDNAYAEIERLEKEIKEQLSLVKGSIPYDLLRELKRIPE